MNLQNIKMPRSCSIMSEILIKSHELLKGHNRSPSPVQITRKRCIFNRTNNAAAVSTRPRQVVGVKTGLERRSLMRVDNPPADIRVRLDTRRTRLWLWKVHFKAERRWWLTTARDVRLYLFRRVIKLLWKLFPPVELRSWMMVYSACDKKLVWFCVMLICVIGLVKYRYGECDVWRMEL